MNQNNDSKKDSQVLGRENTAGKPSIASPLDYKILYENEVARNRNLYLSLFRDNQTIMLMIDPSNRQIINVNSAAEQFYGYTHAVFTQMKLNQIVALSDEEITEKIQAAKTNNQNYFLSKHRLANNEIRTVEVHNQFAVYAGKEIIYATVYDITERVKAQKALEKSEERFRKIFRTSPDAVSISSINDGKYVEINESFTTITGYTQEDILGKTAIEVDIWFDKKDREYLVKTLKEKGAVKNFAARFRMKNGNIIHGLMSANIIDIDGLPHILSISRNIEGFVKTREALRQSETKFRKAFKVSPDAININRMEDGMYININEGFTAITGYTPEDVEGKTSFEIDIWDDLKDREYLVKTLKEKGVIKNFAARFRMKGGSIIHGLMSANIIDIDGVQHILTVTRDMEEYIKTHEALQQSELKFRGIFRTSPDTITISRLIDGRYIEVNESFTTNTGYSQEEAMGKTAFELNLWFDNKDRNKVIESRERKRLYTEFTRPI